MRLLILLILLAPLCGCDNGGVSGLIDQLSFGKWGTTIFSSPTPVSMKEIHLDTGSLLGRQIVIEGNLVDIGKHHTHIVVSDNTARMLVVLTQMRSPETKVKNQKTHPIKILGVVERGKKGLPYVSAIAINDDLPKRSS